MKSLRVFLEDKLDKTTYNKILNILKKQPGHIISFEDNDGPITLDSIYSGNDEQVVISTIYLDKAGKEILVDCDPDTEIPSGLTLKELISDEDDLDTILDLLEI